MIYADPVAIESDPLAPMWERGRYLSLLNPVSGDRVRESLATLRVCLAATHDPRGTLVAALEGGNWRPHLVAAAAMVLRPSDPATIAAAWRAFDAPSWVAPQLAVALSMRDAAFEDDARLRLAGFQGPQLVRPRVKAATALLHLCTPFPWAAPIAAAPIAKAWLAGYERGDLYAERWREVMLEEAIVS